jgi:hypothetical protein
MEIYRNAGHMELFEDGVKMNLKLTADSIKLSAPRTEILFTYDLVSLLSNIYSTLSGWTRTNPRQLNFWNWEKKNHLKPIEETGF